MTTYAERFPDPGPEPPKPVGPEPPYWGGPDNKTGPTAEHMAWSKVNRVYCEWLAASRRNAVAELVDAFQVMIADGQGIGMAEEITFVLGCAFLDGVGMPAGHGAAASLFGGL